MYVFLDYAYHRAGLYVGTWLFTAHVTRTGSYVDLYYAPHGTGLHVDFHDAHHGIAPALMLDGFDGFDGRSRIYKAILYYAKQGHLNTLQLHCRRPSLCFGCGSAH